MATTTVHNPQGEKRVVKHPDGATKEEIIAYAKANWANLNPPKEEKGLIGKAVDVVGGVGEMMAQGVTGLAATAGGTVAGALQYVGTMGKEDGLETLHQIQEAGTYQPKYTDTGEGVSQWLGEKIGALHEYGYDLGGEVVDSTGSPFLGAATATLVGGSAEIAMTAFGLRGVRSQAAKARTRSAAVKVAEELKAKKTQVTDTIDGMEYTPTTKTVAGKAPLKTTIEKGTSRATRDFNDPVVLEEMAARILKDKQVEQGFRELGLRNLQQKYPDRSNRAVNAGKFGQGGAVTPGVFVEAVQNIYRKVRGDKKKFAGQLSKEFGPAMDSYALALHKQIEQMAGKLDVEQVAASAKAADSASVAAGKAFVDNPPGPVDLPGGYKQNTVGATPETSGIADMLISPKTVRPWEATIADAQKLGFTPKQVAKLRKSVEDLDSRVLAATDLAAKENATIRRLAAAAKTEEDFWVLGEHLLKLGSITDDVAKIKSSAGRTLNSVKIMADEGRVADRIQTIYTAFGGVDNLPAVAKAIATLDDAGLMKLAKKQASWWGAASEVYINALLTSTLTHARNTVGNAAYLGYTIPQTYAAAVTGKIPILRGRAPNAMSFTEANAYAVAAMKALKDSVYAAGRVAKTSEPSIRYRNRTIIDEASKIETFAHKQITSELLPDFLQGTPLAGAFDLVGKGVRKPGDLLLMEDAFFKSMAYSMEMERLIARSAMEQLKAKQITREGMHDYMQGLRQETPREFHKTAMDWAHKVTFTKELGRWGKQFQQLANTHPSVRFVTPFIRTPINLQKEALTGTPLALLNKGIRQQIRAGGAEGNRAAAHIMLGSAVAYTIMEMAMDGKFIGSAPLDPGAREVFRAKYKGATNGMIMPDGSIVSLNGIGVLDTITGIAADAALVYDNMDDMQWGEITEHLVVSVTNNLLDKTFSQGVFNIITASVNPEQYGYRLAEYANTFTMPRIAAQAARNQDPTVRTPRGFAPEDIPNTGQDPSLRLATRLLDQVKRDTPGYRQDLPIGYDIIGRPQIGHASWVNPLVTFDAEENAVVNELYRLKVPMRPPRAEVLGAKLDKYQHADYERLTGKYFENIAQQMLRNPSWDRTPTGIKQDMLRKAQEKAKKWAQGDLIKLHPELKLRIPATKRHAANKLRSTDVPKRFK